MDDLAFLRAFHVLGVVLWIGGVALVTTALLPGASAGRSAAEALVLFTAVERRFAWQARLMVVIVGITGFAMVERLSAWNRFRELDFWWMHAMVGTWLVFALLLFVLEPLLGGRLLGRLAERAPALALARLRRLHAALLALSLVTIFGAVAGSHGAGWHFF